MSSAASLRVAHVFPSHSWGGAEIYTLELAQAQHERGLAVLLWCAEGSRLHKEAQQRSLPHLTDRVSTRMDVKNLWNLAKVIRREKITHLHLHWSGGPWAFWGIKKLVSVKLIYHIHMWMKHSKKDPVHWAVYKGLDRVLVAGHRLKMTAQRCLPIAKKKYQELPYAIGFQKSSPQKLPFPTGIFIFGVFARIDRQKGQLEFLKALKKLLEEGIPAAALLVGDPTHGEAEAEAYAKEVQEFLKDPVFVGRVIRRGFSTDYLQWLAACQVLVAPSYQECYALILLHAFSQGVPVLSTDAGGTPDLVTEERGWLVPPETVEPLYEKMKWLVHNSEVVAQKGQKAQAFVQAQHSFESVTDKLKSIYLEL